MSMTASIKTPLLPQKTIHTAAVSYADQTPRDFYFAKLAKTTCHNHDLNLAQLVAQSKAADVMNGPS